MRLRHVWGLLCVAVFTMPLLLALPARAADATDDRPARGIGLYSDYSGVIVPVGEKVQLDVTVETKGKQDEVVNLKLASVPKGWRASLKGGSFTVTGVAVPSGKTRSLTFTAEPDKGVGPGTYEFGLEGVTQDGQIKAHYAIAVTTQERSRLGAADLLITTSYPILRGQSDSTFEFSLTVANKSDADRMFNLAAQAPEKWEVNFKPGYESKQISSIRIKGGSDQTVGVSITPPKDASAGEYPVLVRIASGESQADVKLQVVLTGIYKLEAATASGLLSAEAVSGKTTATTFIVKNVGSAVNKNITLNSYKPENWKVEFKPEKIGTLEPGQSTHVEATITPASTALVGDYSVTLSADGEKASGKSVDLRVNVKPATVWSWVGVGLIALVIGGMGGLFAWLGRR